MIDTPKMIITRESIRKIFSDVLEVILGYNVQFLEKLQERILNWTELSLVSDIFVEMVIIKI